MDPNVRFLGIDLAWGAGAATGNETGVTALDANGDVIDAGWTVGLTATCNWISTYAGETALIFIDAPLVIANASHQRVCEREVGHHYGATLVSANSTNLGTKKVSGVILLQMLLNLGSNWRYDDGVNGPPALKAGEHMISETYPYTTLVGAPEFGYAVRPVYKRKPKSLNTAQFGPQRAVVCQNMAIRLASLKHQPVRLDISTHAQTASLLSTWPIPNRDHKHLEDLVDATLCAWTAKLWATMGTSRVQALGQNDTALDPSGRRATIMAPYQGAQQCNCAAGAPTH